MIPFAGVEAMVLGAVASGIFFGLLALVLTRSFGFVNSAAWCGLLWSLVVIGLVTLLPLDPHQGVVLAEERMGSCSRDIGGPAPEGFWIFDGAQRTLNTVLFVPSGIFGVLAVSRTRWGWLLALPGLAALAAYSVAIEMTQLELARLDRACDLTDVVDNVTGAVIGFGIGIALLPILRPWRGGKRARAREK